ncbi:MAG: hypothetical protein AM325_001875 [Candidatus Thorarchaeota archaeon SMTZ1-45]|nr:MAG: hypothetical protein AM325_03685 [Candidatus Thorarchaeota archaeon SMTZ1-45]
MKLDKQRLELILISIFPLLIGAGLAALILTSGGIGDILAQNSQIFSFADVAIQAIISTGLGTLVVATLFFTIQKQGPRARRTIIAFIVSPVLTVSFYILGQSLLLIIIKGATQSIWPSIFSIATLGILLISFAFIMMDSVPSYLRNFFVAFYGSVFGTFLGIIFLTASMFVLVISVVAEDFFLTRYSPVAESAYLIDTPGSDPFDYTRIQSKTAAIGVGDYIAFSLISAHSLIFFPLYVWIMSVSLAIVGITINMTVLARENEILPGIPLPALLALFPWVVHIISLPFLI